MTHSVNLEVGMTAIRRDGTRVGKVELNSTVEYPFLVGGSGYKAHGKWVFPLQPHRDIIAAGFPWAELGAQAGDTVRCVWSGYNPGILEWPEFIKGSPCDILGGANHPDSLYVIEARAAKPAAVYHYEVTWPADRPRASHKLDLQDGDVVELVAWQDGRTDFIGVKGVQKDGLVRLPDVNRVSRNSFYPKGHRPLFRVISRAADATPDGLIRAGVAGSGGVFPNAKPVVWTELVIGENVTQPVLRMPEAADAKQDYVIGSGMSGTNQGDSTKAISYMLRCTFPHGSNTGTVTREKL